MIKLPPEILQAIESGGTVVVPSGQRAEAARRAYAAAALAQGKRVWSTPDVLPLDAWLAREIGRRAASDATLPRILAPAEDWLLWREATDSLTTELDLIARAPLAEGLRRAERLAFEFAIDIVSPRASGAEQMLLREVAQRVRARQKEWHAQTPARLAASLPQIGDERPVIFAGFLELSPQLQALVAARRAKDWDTRLKETTTAASARVVIATDTTDELERIAHWCRQRLEAQSDARLLIVMPDAANVRERFVALLEHTIDPQSVMGESGSASTPLAVIEGGEPLSRAPVVAHALASLEWLSGKADFELVSDWLRAPYWATPDFAARCKLDLDLRERVPLELGLKDMLAALARVRESHALSAEKLRARITQAANALGVGTATPRVWSERFHAALDALGWPGGRPLTSDEQQTCERFLALLKELGGLSAQWGVVSLEKALRWLRELAERTHFSPAAGDAPITVSPLLTDPVVHYDGIWVAGLTADVWPEPVQPDPFIPLRSQIAAGVPVASAAGRLTSARALTAAWSAAADELVLSAPGRADDMEVLPSPLLNEFPLAPSPWGKVVTPAKAGAQLKTSSWLPLQLHRTGVLERFKDAAGTPWPRDVPLPAGTRSLELQNECPFRAYAELRLGGEPIEAPQPGVAADTRGRLLHLALEKLWSRLGESTALLALPDEDCDVLIARCVDEAAAFIWRGSVATAAQTRERHRARRLIGALCRLERERAPFEVEHTELETQLAVGGAVVRLRIDRIDSLSGGGLAVLDYKSGRAISPDWYGERPTHVQLLAYLAAVGEGARAMAAVNITAREVRFTGLAAASLLPRVPADQTWDLRRGEWLARVERMAQDFLTGHAAVDPKPHACDFCHLAAVCRIADLGTEAPEEEPSDD